MEYYIKDGFKLNAKAQAAISKAVTRNDGECPCAGNTGKTREERLCPCKMYRIDGHCECGLYLPIDGAEYRPVTETEKYTATIVGYNKNGDLVELFKIKEG